jgi:hypothetical protein
MLSIASWGGEEKSAFYGSAITVKISLTDESTSNPPGIPRNFAIGDIVPAPAQNARTGNLLSL